MQVVFITSYINRNRRTGRDSSVGIATRYGLDGPGIESLWGRDFPQPFRPALEPMQPPVQWVQGLFPGGKAAGAWGFPPHPLLVPRLKKGYSYTSTPPLGPSGLVIGEPLPLTLQTEGPKVYL
jgi:hypothetical protein